MLCEAFPTNSPQMLHALPGNRGQASLTVQHGSGHSGDAAKRASCLSVRQISVIKVKLTPFRSGGRAIS